MIEIMLHEAHSLIDAYCAYLLSPNDNEYGMAEQLLAQMMGWA